MNCKKTQELILTDYIDGQITPKLQRQLEKHISACDECRRFEQLLQQKAIAPFRSAKEIKPPNFIWQRIKESIILEKETQHARRPSRLRDSWSRIFTIPKPVFVIAAIMIIVISVVVTKLPFRTQSLVSAYIEEQIEFLSSLDINGTSYSDTDYMNLGTTIEEYVL